MGPQRPTCAVTTHSRHLGQQTQAGGPHHTRGGDRGRERENTARLHRATRPNKSPPDHSLHVTGRRLHPTLSKNHLLELGRPTCATNKMVQSIPVPDVPWSKIPPALRYG